jgi:hypothetical protein
VTDEPVKICIYPGCDRPAVPPSRSAAAAFCDLDEHNALTAHQERQRLPLTTNDDQEVEL